ncbi:FAD-dependent oxidoreductase [Dactylosporangium sp. NPDC051485]|uniref:NAD(P)/FAD-dependent oxidoreductase n=1 Tax=Dactylosporangium sp. NPDC051485 TaxID=3154846 RepID=UPI00341CC6EC
MSDGICMSRTIVVVGASVAGVRAVRALRFEGFNGELILVGEETELPYDKPPLSKAILTQDDEPPTLRLISHDELEQLRVSLRLGSAAVALDPRERLVHLADGASVSYDDVVIATGASARQAPWATSSGVLTLRTLSDARALRSHLVPGARVALIGGGLIGGEVAAAARSRGCRVTMIDMEELPLQRAFGPLVADRIGRLHADRGVAARLGRGVRSVTGELGALAITLDDASVVEADVALAALGARPNDGWLSGSGLTVADGVVCDGDLRAAPHVFAVGDVARVPHPASGRYRAEHWTNAVDQARHVARVLVGADIEEGGYAPSDYVWNDLYDWKLQAVGSPRSHGPTAVVRDLEVDRPVAAVVHADEGGVATGGVAINWPRALVTLRRAVDGVNSAQQVAEALSELPAPVMVSD